MKIQLGAKNYSIETDLEKYTYRKVQGIQKQLPRAIRNTSELTVQFSQRKATVSKLNTCELTLQLAGEQLIATETTQHMYAALDVAVAVIEQQVRSYKKQLLGGGLRARMARRARKQV